MIQRIQTLYLALVVFISAYICFSFIYLFSNYNASPVYLPNEPIHILLFIISGTLAFFSIFLFRKRDIQIVLGRLNIISNLILLGLFLYKLPKLSGKYENFEYSIVLFLPFISIVLLLLANKAIKKDEAIVKSVDRLR